MTPAPHPGPQASLTTWDDASAPLVRGAISAMSLDPETCQSVQRAFEGAAESVRRGAGHVLRAHADRSAPRGTSAQELTDQAAAAFAALPAEAQNELTGLAELLSLDADPQARADGASLFSQRLTRSLVEQEPLAAILREPEGGLPGWVGWIALLVGALVLKTFVFGLSSVNGGGMVPGLYGDHLKITCKSCAFEFPVGVHSREWKRRDSLEVTFRCPVCRTDGVRVADSGDPWDGSSCVVNKLARAPARYDVWLYEDGGSTFIKRVVGLPGETLEIVNGDVTINGALAPKPVELQDQLWIPVHDSEHAGRADAPWEPVARVVGAWQLEDARRINSRGALAPWLAYAEAITNLQSYNRKHPTEPVAVADLRVRAAVTPSGAKTIQLAVVEDGRMVSARFGVGRGRQEFALAVDEKVVATVQATGLIPNAATPISLAYADDRARLKVGDATVLEWVDADAPRAWCKQAGVRIRADGDAAFEALRIDRDIMYLPSPDAVIDPAKGPVTVPAGSYFLLGDNPQNSSDSRQRGFVPAARLEGKVQWTY